ncbi:LysM peptidoglycan-binding domain-containing protein [Ureibacillus sinduriensis]|uniref:Spore gernimation protein n=1 Tax=Ureibacillus sinduriensis BLB-1 = JCM 15800 TaxID=1384057 RepID=A0A0A3HVZ1_9BACL|nr:LysM peptidoglycan-binding domain-containing protein [Ureibacillus sinduriensis]KGR75370.1 spore gernimation protein [Ureibacillus sinduriensis BLB-1 = JCM 15800]
MLIHVVNHGEALWQIASRYHVNMNVIQQLNQLPDPDHLLPGQALIIPSMGSMHTIQAGENLWSIAGNYGIPINTLMNLNRITHSNLIFPGTTLYIPPTVHVVQPGQNLWQIASLYGTTVQSILSENQLSNPNLIFAGSSLAIPRRKPKIEVNAYTYQRDDEAKGAVNEIGQFLTFLTPFAYLIREDGSLKPFADELMLAAAQAKNVSSMLAITNLSVTSTGTNLAHAVLSSPDIRETLLTNVLQLMKEKGYKGLNIDFEYVQPRDRDNYNQFLQLAVNRLHPQGFFVSTAVAPKTSSEQEGLLYTAHDYEAHGRIADFVVLMTYEWGWRGASPQAISPINQMRRVVEYALSVMPANKIYLGFQVYARDWKIPHIDGATADTFSPQEAVRRASKYNAAIQFDEVAQSPYFRYVDEQGQGHEVWFEDARSAQAKFNLFKQYNLRGISYWALGYPYPQNWALLNANFEII